LGFQVLEIAYAARASATLASGRWYKLGLSERAASVEFGECRACSRFPIGARHGITASCPEISQNSLMRATDVTDHARPAMPFMVATAAILLFTTMDAIVKALPHSIPTIELVAMRYAFGIPLVLLAMWRMRAGWPTLSSWAANTPRGVLNVASILLFFTAPRRLPLAEALTLSYLAPLMLTLMARFVLGERLSRSALSAVLLGLCGVGVIAWGSIAGQVALSGDMIGIGAALGSAVTYATNNLMLRTQAQRDSATWIVLIQHVVPSAIALPVAAVSWQAPPAPIWFVFPLLAMLGVGAQFLLTWAYRRALAGMLASVDYFAFPYAALLGFVFFDEVPSGAVWSGAALILGASLIVTGSRR
jgi:drug/metabolite transporter (DMT)-like permease